MKHLFNSFIILIFIGAISSCQKDNREEVKVQERDISGGCCTFAEVAKIFTEGTGDRCCHHIYKVKNTGTEGLKCGDVTVKDPAGNVICTVGPLSETLLHFYPCPPSDVPGSYSGGVYSVYIGGAFCSTFTVQALCAFE